MWKTSLLDTSAVTVLVPEEELCSPLSKWPPSPGAFAGYLPGRGHGSPSLSPLPTPGRPQKAANWPLGVQSCFFGLGTLKHVKVT